MHCRLFNTSNPRSIRYAPKAFVMSVKNANDKTCNILILEEG